MEVHIKLTPTVSVKVTGETQKDVFREVAAAYELLGEEKCGLCGSTSICPVVRHVTQGKSEFVYYELSCRNPSCRAKLAFGQSQDTKNLFPKRKLDEEGKPDMENGQYGKHNGWTKYRGDKKE